MLRRAFKISQVYEGSRRFTIGKVYTHYKGDTYQIINIAKKEESEVHTSGNDFIVVYERVSLSDKPINDKSLPWARSLEKFGGDVTIEQNGKLITVPRFAEVEEWRKDFFVKFS
jgi:hypothetical protein